MRRYGAALGMVFAAVILMTCSKPEKFVRDNPFDPGGETFVAPEITSVSLSENQAVASGDVAITWTGNETADEFLYTLDTETSDWTKKTAVSFTGLDAGKHTFSVQARNYVQYEGKAVTRSFTVQPDAR